MTDKMKTTNTTTNKTTNLSTSKKSDDNKANNADNTSNNNANKSDANSNNVNNSKSISASGSALNSLPTPTALVATGKPAPTAAPCLTTSMLLGAKPPLPPKAAPSIGKVEPSILDHEFFQKNLTEKQRVMLLFVHDEATLVSMLTTGSKKITNSRGIYSKNSKKN